MEYTTRMGSGPGRAHVNYQCPCSCIGGVIYNTEKPLSKAGHCCCGRVLWVGADAEAKLRETLDPNVEYEWDLGNVALPWGEVAQTAMAWPAAAPSEMEHDHSPLTVLTAERVKDLVCGMMIDPTTAAATSEYRNTTYYFCAVVCKTRFDADPRQFVRSAGLIDRLRRRS
jgi:YHS domain-containing protein